MKAAGKRLTALILALAMCLSLCSVQVWAADEDLDGAVSDSSQCAPEEADTEVESEPEESVTEVDESEAEPEESVTEAEESEVEPEASVAEAEASEAEAEESVAEAEESEAPDTDAAELTPCADSLPRPVNGVITLTENVVLPDGWQMGNTITLDLNGYGLSVPADQEKCVIKINSRGKLTLKDSNPNRVNTITLKDGRGIIDSSATAAPVDGETVQVKGGFITGGMYGCVYNEGSFTMLGGTIIGNTAPDYDGSGMDYSGGAVHVESGSFTMLGGTITRNTAGMGGGGVFLDEGGSFTMQSGSITNNTAADSGGGVSLERGSNFTMKGGTISDNSADRDGGGVSLHEGSTVTMLGGTISGNKARYDGGGVTSKDASCTFTMKGGTIANNSAGRYAGGVDSWGNSTMEGGTISGNTAGENGGGVYSWSCTFTMKGGSISGNTAKENGGGVFNQEGSTVKMSGGAISGNKADKEGGGVFNEEGSTVKMSGGAISGNKADKEGGGVFNEEKSSFTMQEGTISGNTAKENGGGVYQSTGTFTMKGGTISNNTAKENGGGVFNQEGSTVKMSGGAISGNKADKEGGGFYLGSSVELSGKPVITGNKAGASQALSNAYFPKNKNAKTGSPMIIGQKLVLSDKLDAGASIGVSAALIPVTITRSTDKAKGKDYLRCFTSDTNGCLIWAEGNELVLDGKKLKNVITAKNVVCSYSEKAQTVKLNATALGGAKLSYKSSNKKVKVNGKGQVTLPTKFSGVVKITITAAETKAYKKTTKNVTVTVPTATEIQKIKVGKKQISVIWKKNKLAKGYELQFSTKKNFSGAKTVKIPGSKTEYTVKKLKKGVFYVRLRSTIGKAKSRWSKVRTVKVK